MVYDVYLPESFEWVILTSGLIDGSKLKDILKHTEDYVESERLFSWKQFYTHLLARETQGTYLRCAKTELNDTYLNKRERQALLSVMEVIRPPVGPGND